MKKNSINRVYNERYNKYNRKEVVLKLEDTFSVDSDFKVASPGIRQLIVTEWINKILGEMPKIYSNKGPKKKEIILDFYEELSEQMHDVFAYGLVFVVPKKINNKIKFNILDPKIMKDISYVYDEDSDKMILLEYTEEKYIYDLDKDEEKSINLKHIHKYYVDTGIYRYFQQDLDNKKEELIDIQFRDNMVPYFIAMNKMLPLWDTVDSLIDSYDNVFAEMHLDIELSRKKIFIPQSMVISGAKAQADLANSTSKVSKSRAFATIPDATGEMNKPDMFDGKFDATQFKETMDIIMNQISLKTSFGKSYFSHGGKEKVYTSEQELSINENKMNLAKTKYDLILVQLIKLMLTYIYPNKKESDFEIKVSDSIIENHSDFMKKVFQDRQNNFINNEFYLKTTYKTEDIEDMQPTEEELQLALQQKNNTGLSIGMDKDKIADVDKKEQKETPKDGEE